MQQPKKINDMTKTFSKGGYFINIMDEPHFYQSEIREIAQDALEFLDPCDEFTVTCGKDVIFDSKRDDFSILMAIAENKERFLVQIRNDNFDGSNTVHKQKGFNYMTDARRWGNKNQEEDTYYVIRDILTGKEIR